MSLPTTLFDSPEASDKVTSLVIGSMGAQSLQRCVKIFSKATLHRLNHTKGGNLFQYGPAAGFPDFLDKLQKFLQEEYGSEVGVKNLLCTSGATSGLHLAVNLLLPKSKGIIFVENPTYFLALGMFIKDLGHTPVCIPMEADGVNIGAFTQIIEEEYAKRKTLDESPFWAMFYTIPVHHNPTSIVTSPEKCKEIVRLARKYDFFVLCDDVYNLLTFEGSHKRLFAYDDPHDEEYKGGNVISNGSFSKILCPGVRVGWMEMSPRLKSVFESSSILASGGAMNNYASGIVASIMKLGLLKEHLEFIKSTYRRKMSLALTCLNEGLPKGFSFHSPTGGNFIWIVGHSKFNSSEFKKHLLETKKIAILSGAECSPSRFLENGHEDNSFSNAFRISISYLEDKDLKRSIESVCEELKKY